MSVPPAGKKRLRWLEERGVLTQSRSGVGGLSERVRVGAGGGLCYRSGGCARCVSRNTTGDVARYTGCCSADSNTTAAKKLGFRLLLPEILTTVNSARIEKLRRIIVKSSSLSIKSSSLSKGRGNWEEAIDLPDVK